MPNISVFEEKLGHSFKNKNLLEEALTHRSYLNEHPEWRVPHNERLEFLGDAVLELAVTEALFSEFPKEPEGQLTVLRAALVNYQQLAKVAQEMGLQDFVLVSRGEQGDSSKAREVILANAIEAVIGAVYLDGGFDAAKKCITAFVLPHLPEIMETKSYKDAKSELQEHTQEKFKITPSYRVIDEHGPAHKKTFIVSVNLDEKEIGRGSGSSKQEAEIEAAKSALTSMNE